MIVALVSIFVGLIGVILAVYAFLSIKKVEHLIQKIIVYAAMGLTAALFIVTLINSIVELSGGFWEFVFSTGWIALGFGCGTVLAGVIAIVLTKIDLKNLFSKKEKPKEEPKVEEVVDKRIINGNTVLLSASANVGTGLWTSICVAFAAIFGVESKNFTRKMDRASKAVRIRLGKEMSKYPDFTFADFRIVKEGKLTYTGTVIGTKK